MSKTNQTINMVINKLQNIKKIDDSCIELKIKKMGETIDYLSLAKQNINKKYKVGSALDEFLKVYFSLNKEDNPGHKTPTWMEVILVDRFKFDNFIVLKDNAGYFCGVFHYFSDSYHPCHECEPHVETNAKRWRTEFVKEYGGLDWRADLKRIIEIKKQEK